MREQIEQRLAELQQAAQMALNAVHASQEWRNYIAIRGGIAELQLLIAPQAEETQPQVPLLADMPTPEMTHD